MIYLLVILLSCGSTSDACGACDTGSMTDEEFDAACPDVCTECSDVCD